MNYFVAPQSHAETGENRRLGLLLSLKAVTQLVANPLVAVVSRRRGFGAPLLFGGVNLVASALLYAAVPGNALLAAPRALHGVSSACFNIAGKESAPIPASLSVLRLI